MAPQIQDAAPLELVACARWFLQTCRSSGAFLEALKWLQARRTQVGDDSARWDSAPYPPANVFFRYSMLFVAITSGPSSKLNTSTET
jgi:hypothetical protein